MAAEIGEAPPVIVALGKFDAMHKGHRALAVAAAEMGGQPWLLSFSGMSEVGAVHFLQPHACNFLPHLSLTRPGGCRCQCVVGARLAGTEAAGGRLRPAAGAGILGPAVRGGGQGAA